VGAENARKFSLLLAGDVVKAKKPAPDIYLMAARELQVLPAQCVVVEDSQNGLLSAVAAGMKCVVTINDYTREEDFQEAALVATCLGDPDGERCVVLANRCGAFVDGYFTVAVLEKVLES
jgi:beta-phosphoglucomutase-like phosphatase (HAD superfamily)